MHLFAARRHLDHLGADECSRNHGRVVGRAQLLRGDTIRRRLS